MARAPAAKAGGPGFDSYGCHGFFSSSWLTDVDGMMDLWFSSTVRLSTDVNGEIYGALVQLAA